MNLKKVMNISLNQLVLFLISDEFVILFDHKDVLKKKMHSNYIEKKFI